MIYIDLSDRIIQRAKNDRIAKYTRLTTQVVLWSGVGFLIANGTIGIKLIGEMLIIGSTNKITKKLIKNVKGSIYAKTH